MIVKEHYMTRYDGVELYRSYSDKDVYIRKVGTDELYTEAIDVSASTYEYEETNISIDEPSAGDATEADYIAALKELGCEI